jgi:hypothetical protein
VRLASRLVTQCPVLVFTIVATVVHTQCSVWPRCARPAASVCLCAALPPSPYGWYALAPDPLCLGTPTAQTGNHSTDLRSAQSRAEPLCSMGSFRYECVVHFVRRHPRSASSRCRANMPPHAGKTAGPAGPKASRRPGSADPQKREQGRVHVSIPRFVVEALPRNIPCATLHRRQLRAFPKHFPKRRFVHLAITSQRETEELIL